MEEGDKHILELAMKIPYGDYISGLYFDSEDGKDPNPDSKIDVTSFSRSKLMEHNSKGGGALGSVYVEGPMLAKEFIEDITSGFNLRKGNDICYVGLILPLSTDVKGHVFGLKDYVIESSDEFAYKVLEVTFAQIFRDNIIPTLVHYSSLEDNLDMINKFKEDIFSPFPRTITMIDRDLAKTNLEQYKKELDTWKNPIIGIR